MIMDPKSMENTILRDADVFVSLRHSSILGAQLSGLGVGGSRGLGREVWHSPFPPHPLGIHPSIQLGPGAQSPAPRQEAA